MPISSSTTSSTSAVTTSKTLSFTSPSTSTLARHHVDADPIRFQQALWNLIKNAIKFTPAGGRLSVRSRNRDRDLPRPPKTPPTSSSRSSDTGIGIEPDVLPRIFDVLEQGGISTTSRFGGLGLGLTISRSIIEQHGGRLDAHSPGAGQAPPSPSKCPPPHLQPRSSRTRARRWHLSRAGFTRRGPSTFCSWRIIVDTGSLSPGFSLHAGITCGWPPTSLRRSRLAPRPTSIS